MGLNELTDLVGGFLFGVVIICGLVPDVIFQFHECVMKFLLLSAGFFILRKGLGQVSL